MGRTVRIFVSYSHEDSRHVNRATHDSLLGFLVGLEEEGVELWSDQKIATGDLWDDEIKRRIADSDIALALVSQAFLDSRYCKDEEVARFLAQNLVIFPVILSPCEWWRHKWLEVRQHFPGGRETLEEHYTRAGKRKRLFCDVKDQLRRQVQRIQRAPAARDSPASGTAKPPDLGSLTLLPYLCDRSDQETRLETALADQKEKRNRRPLAVLIHGDQREAHGELVKRLELVSFPRLLEMTEENQTFHREKPTIYFNDPKRGKLGDRLGPLKRELARLLCGRSDAGLEEMAGEVARRRCPVMIDVAFPVNDEKPTSDESPTPAAELMRAWLEYLAGWPDLPPGPAGKPLAQLLVFVLRFSYPKSAPNPLAFWKRGTSRNVERLMKEIEAAPPDHLGVVALPRLESIGKTDVLLWVRKHARDVVGGAGSALDPQVLVERLEKAAEKLFDEESERLPMSRLGPELRDRLERCLYEGG